MSDLDIEALDPQLAREYVLSFITTLKKTQKERAILQEEQELWEKRVKLAEERDEPQLRKGAEQRVQELKMRIASLLGEERSLKQKIPILKEKLKSLQSRLPLEVDPDYLLAQLRMVVGEEDTLERKLKEEQAEQDLKELKRKMGNEGG